MSDGGECVREGVSAIRQKARDEDHALRNRQRSHARDARRTNLREVAETLQTPSMEEVLKLTQALKKHKRVPTLQRLRLGLVTEEAVEAFMASQGALYAVLGCLTGVDAGVQREALCVLVNLGLGCEQRCVEVARRAGTYLVTLMASPNPQLQDPAAWCVGNLCGGHAKVCRVLHHQGVEDALTRLLESYTPHVLHSASYALLQYLLAMPERINAVLDNKVLRRLVEVLGVVGPEVGDAAWLVFLASTNPALCPALLEVGVVQAAFTQLEQLVNRQSLNVSAATGLVRCVMNCVAAVPSAAVQVCYRSEQLVCVCKALLYCPHPHLRSETLHLLATVINCATQDSITGKCLVDDLSLKPRLECAVRSALASSFSPVPTEGKAPFSPGPFTPQSPGGPFPFTSPHDVTPPDPNHSPIQ